jgi:hypothetical protein
MRSCSAWIRAAVVAFILVGISHVAAAGEVTIIVSDPDGVAARVGAPVEVEVDPAAVKALHGPSGGMFAPWRVELVEVPGTAAKPAQPVWGQWDVATLPGVPASRPLDVLQFEMPPGPAGQRKFLLKASPGNPPSVMQATDFGTGGYKILRDDKAAILVYRFSSVSPPGFFLRYPHAHEDYIHPLYGPSGEVLTDDFPKDHPHHRGIWWSWPVTRWKKEVGDIWALVGVLPCTSSIASEGGPVFGKFSGVHEWKWGERWQFEGGGHAIVRKTAVIRAYRKIASGRFVDVDVHVTSLEDGVAIGGRPHGGYGGFAYRAAPTKEQRIVRHVDPPGAKPRRSWLDYSGIFPGGKQVAGVAIFEHPTNPRYPNELQEYPSINCVMPAFPGEREVPIPKGHTLTLKHRLWIHPGRADEKMLADVWSAYANPPKAKLVKE